MAKKSKADRTDPKKNKSLAIRNILEKSLLAKHLGKGKILVVTNETVAPLLRPAIGAMLLGLDYSVLQLPDGETYKNMDILNQIYSFLLSHNYDRGCTLIACVPFWRSPRRVASRVQRVRLGERSLQ